MVSEVVVALVAGLVQGIFEWLPISSEGNVAIALSAFGYGPEAAVQYALFLHAGTAMSATAYYRSDLASVVGTIPAWRPDSAFGEDTATTTFLGLATVTSGVVGIAAYRTLAAVVSELTGGAFVALVGALLVVTGLLQRFADGVAVHHRTTPDLVDGVLVGVLQGLAILPGVSRSGTTTSALLLRGHEGEDAFGLSFLLSIPAALGAGVLVVLDVGGLPSATPAGAILATVVAAVVGYLTIDALMRVVRRIAFWVVCVGLGGLAMLGGLVVVVV